MLKYSEKSIVQSLNLLFNKIQKNGSYPECCKYSIIVPIPKINQPKETNDFRPISIRCSLSNIFDSIIAKRLIKQVEQKNILPIQQTGFRQNRNVTENLIRLQQDGHSAFKHRKYLVAVFIDISKAFDTMPINYLIKTLIKFNTSNTFINYINNLLTSRKTSVKFNNTMSDQQLIEEGVPQGSPISPILFNIYSYNNLSECQSNSGQFADDIAIWTTGTTIEECEETLNKDTLQICKQYTARNQSLNIEKCAVLVITRKRGENEPKIYINKKLLPVRRHVKYLGITFDRGLNQQEHLRKTIQKARHQTQLITRLINSKIKQSLKILLYKTLIRPILEYGSEIQNDAAPQLLTKLDSIQHKNLTKALRVNRLSHRRDVNIEAEIAPLSVRRNIQTLKYGKHLIPDTPIHDYFAKLDSKNRLKKSYRKSQYERKKSLEEKLQIQTNIFLPAGLKKYKYILWREFNQTNQRNDQRSVHYKKLGKSVGSKAKTSALNTSRYRESLQNSARLATLPLNSFLYSINCSTTKACNCDNLTEETTEHFLLQCKIYNTQRLSMLNKLNSIYRKPITQNTEHLLLSSDIKLNYKEKLKVVSTITTYIQETKRLKCLAN